MTDLVIRALTPADDLAAFGELTHASYTNLPDHPVDPPYDASLRDISGRLATNTVLGAFLDVEPAGCVTCVDGPSDPYAEELLDGEGGFRMLAVGAAAQGKGVGRALADACVERIRDLGHQRVLIHSGTWMSGAHRMYERMGFERRPDRDIHIASIGIDLMAFGLDLTAGTE